VIISILEIKLTCLYCKFGSLAKDNLKLISHTAIDSEPKTSPVHGFCLSVFKK